MRNQRNEIPDSPWTFRESKNPYSYYGCVTPSDVLYKGVVLYGFKEWEELEKARKLKSKNKKKKVIEIDKKSA
jgi:hypothetical protein